jgi:hypothetical protein
MGFFAGQAEDFSSSFRVPSSWILVVVFFGQIASNTEYHSSPLPKVPTKNELF